MQAYRSAAEEFSRGNPEQVKGLYSRGEDITLANPFGPAVQGWDAVSVALDFASSRFHGGDVEEFDLRAMHVGGDLVTIFTIERWRARVGDSPEVSSFELRVTSVFRKEDGVWKLAHRHADPIATVDPAGPLRKQ